METSVKKRAGKEKRKDEGEGKWRATLETVTNSREEDIRISPVLIRAMPKERITIAENTDHRLFARWEVLADTANKLYEQEVTGNLSLPKTKAEWDRQMCHIRLQFQTMYLGGLWARDLKNFYQCGEDEEVDACVRMTLSSPQGATISASSPPGRTSSVVDDRFRCGGKEVAKRKLSDPEVPESARPQQPALTLRCGNNAILGAQESLGALVDRTLVGETIKLLSISHAPETQSAYLRGWKFWRRYCDMRQKSPWIDMSLPDWGRELLTYLTWEHTVMKLGGSALTTRFCAIKFTHLVEGKEDFENKDHRIHALIEAVKRKGGKPDVTRKSRVVEMGGKSRWRK